MKTIYKYALDVKGFQSVSIPDNAEILTVQTQNGIPCIWAMVDTDKITSKDARMFEVFGTGHPMYEDMGVDRKYIGTFQINGGALVFHLFERLN